MGLPDVYAEDFARRVDEAAASQLEPLRDDPFMLGFFIGNEPPKDRPPRPPGTRLAGGSAANKSSRPGTRVPEPALTPFKPVE
jgi:hypothetical protein